MNELELYKKILESCDESLRDSFVRRMEAAEPIAEAKIRRNLEVYIPRSEEQSLERICFGVSSELQPQMISLWHSLMRMNRSRQYAYYIRNIPDYKLLYDKFIVSALPDGDIACASDIKDAVSDTFRRKCLEFGNTDAAIAAVESGEAPLCAVKTSSFYDTAWLYSKILYKDIFVNNFSVLEDGSMLALLSRGLVDDRDNTIITVALAVRMDVLGDMAQQISVLSECGLNIEYLAVKTQSIDDDDRKKLNIVFIELSGGMLTAERTRTAFLQMEKECPFFRIMGYRKSVQGGQNDT